MKVISSFIAWILAAVWRWYLEAVALIVGAEAGDDTGALERARIRHLDARARHWDTEAARLERRGSPRATEIRRRARRDQKSKETLLSGATVLGDASIRPRS